MTDEAKALVERLRLKSRDTRETSPATCDDAANLIETQAREIERLRGALKNPPEHKFWLAGEADCPAELKAGNGELHTLRCKVCGEDNLRNPICLGGL